MTKRTESEITAEALNLALKMVDYEAGTLRVNAMRERIAGNSRPGAQAVREKLPPAAPRL